MSQGALRCERAWNHQRVIELPHFLSSWGSM
jgi:hypothetical protein